jgi:D-inositol-3-phosphate glycosyltransferase
MRIAMISEHASPLAVIGGVDSGGQNIYVAQVAQHLVAQGHRVDVFTRRDDAALAAVVELAPGLRVVHVAAGPEAFVPKERLLEHMPEFARFCEAWFRTAGPYDVLHANFFMSGWVGMRLQETFDLPLVTTFHALGLVRREHQKEADAFPAERIDIEHALATRSDRLVAECPQDEVDLQRLYGADPVRMAMVPCGFDAGEFEPQSRAEARTRLGLPADEFMVLQLGRMVPRKGIETVVRAMACPPCEGMRLRVVGGDCEMADSERTPEIGRLQAVARECGVADRVVFEGRKTRTALRDWYAAADVFVTTPWYEPFGITPLEAMACARPVVGSAVGGVQYSVVDGVTGMLVPPKDPPALALALAALRADPAAAAAMGEAGLARARASFTWDGVARQLAAVFADAAASRAACREAAAQASLLHVSGLDARPDPRPRAGAPLRPAIFIDKDGTLVEDVPYNVDPSLLRFTPRAIRALRLWRDAGYRLVVITNQSGLGRGLFDQAALARLHDALAARLAREDVPIDGFFACPHVDADGCACRKPHEGLLREAARALAIDLARSWMVGDILNDVEAGHRAGCRSVLLDAGHETEWQADALRTPEHVCSDLLEAAHAILQPTHGPSVAGVAAPARTEAAA